MEVPQTWPEEAETWNIEERIKKKLKYIESQISNLDWF